MAGKQQRVPYCRNGLSAARIIGGFNAFLAAQVDDAGEFATQEPNRSLARNVKMRRSGSKADMRWEVQDRLVQRDQGAAGDASGGGGI